MEDKNRKDELQSGRYRSEDLDCLDPFERYIIEMDVKVTKKSYIFILREFKSNYGATQMKDFFRKSKRVLIRRNKPSGHTIRIWSSTEFTFYPYQIGVPYVFKKYKGIPC